MTRAFLIRGAVIAVFALAWLAGGRSARADPPVSAARDLYEAGLRSYRAGNYDDAIAKLQASYQLVPAPGLLYDQAQAQRMKRDCAQARILYRQFLQQSPNGPVEQLARARLAEMDRCVADAASTPAAGGAPIAGSLQPTIPTNAAAPARPLALTAAPPAAARPELALSSGRAGAAHDAPAPARRSWLAGHRAATVAGATALGFVAAAGYFAWRADVMSDRVSSMFLPGQPWTAAGMSAEHAGHTSQTLGLVTAVGALVSGGIAVWLAKRR